MASIVHAYQWDTANKQCFVAINPSRDEISLYESVFDGTTYSTAKQHSRGDFDSIQSYSYSLIEDGLVCIGQTSGTVSVFNVKNETVPLVNLKPKQARPCNSASFSRNGLLAVGLDKVRNDNCLLIWDEDQYATRAGTGADANDTGDNTSTDNNKGSGAGQTPLHGYIPNEVISSVVFLPNSPNSLLCGSYKFIRELDVRTNSPSFQCPAKYSHNLTVNHVNDTYFASCSEDGGLAIWDRRYMKSGLATSEPALAMSRLFVEPMMRKVSSYSPPFRFSLSRWDEFTVLHGGDLIRRWQMGLVPGTGSRSWSSKTVPSSAPSQLQQGQPLSFHRATPSEHQQHSWATPSESRHSYLSKTDTLFISSVLDSKTDHDRVVGFDYALDARNKYRVNFMCIRQSGQVFRMDVVESPDACKFDPYNNVAVVEPEGITIIEAGEKSMAMVGGGHAVERKGSTSKFSVRTGGGGAGAVTANANVGGPGATVSGAAGNSGSASGGVAGGGGAVADMMRHRRPSILSETSSTAEDHFRDAWFDGMHEDGEAYEGILHHLTVLNGDISVLIHKRAVLGYSTDCVKNIEILGMDSSRNVANSEYLKYAWSWLSLAVKSEAKGTMLCNGIDLGFEGVTGIWEGQKGLAGQKRYENKVTERDFTATVTKIITSKKRIFTSAQVSGGVKEAHRQLCLRVAGWNFELSALEDKLRELEDAGKHEKAAGWAVFHGDVRRAVTALAGSRKERLRLMSTAVAGYLAYKDTEANSPWKEQCRRLASELENPYLRAIFAYIADGSWLDVLDEASLPLVERLGIALRFLPENELTTYLNQLTDKAVAQGDLEGIILTGITPKVVPLLQSYVDKTSDVQTASLIASFGCPRYFRDKRVDCWVAEYCSLLNSWRMFNQRAKFEVSRTHLSKRSNGTFTTRPVPKQIYLRCNHCKKVIQGPPVGSGGGASSDSTSDYRHRQHQNQRPLLIGPSRRIKHNFQDNGVRCEHCQSPLPLCAVCLLPMGIPASSNPSQTKEAKLTAQFEKWPVFCLSCNHGCHAGHADEWFSRYDMCPVPDCHCLCNSS